MHEPSLGNVVIIDDNPNNLQVLGGILAQAGYTPRPALSGALGLRAIAVQPPDVVLLDIRMPDMDGYATCRALKSSPQTEHVPVIFISALDAIEDKLSAFQAGGVDYLTKPFQPEEVLARVRTHIELARTRRSLADSNARLNALMNELVLAEKLRSLGALAAGLAHELNTPIGNALLATSTIEETLQAALANPEQTPNRGDLLSANLDCAHLALRNLERAERLISAIKEMTVDQSSERRRQINLNTIITEFAGATRILLGNTAHVIECDIPADIEIDTYPGPLEQVLGNLVQNAIVHAFDGIASGTITIDAARAGEGIELNIRDNGRGIPAENLSRIFDPFFTTKLGRGGSGLGLHIAYNLVGGMLGGRISVTSSPQGSTFTLHLPLSAPEHGR